MQESLQKTTDTNNPKKEHKCLTLFTTFFKIGAFTFGGGYAMIPLIQKEVVETHKWISDEDILNVTAIAESTPGPVAVNSATFVGYKVCGSLGSFCATLGVVLPSFLVILLLSAVLQEFQSLAVVQYAFVGIRAAVLALILKALISMYQKCPKNKVSYFLMVLAFVLVAFIKTNAIYAIITCGLIGLLSPYVAAKGRKNNA